MTPSPTLDVDAIRERLGKITREEWIGDGVGVYALYHPPGQYRYEDGKAIPSLVNRFSLSVQHRQGWDTGAGVTFGCSEEEAVANAAFIAHAPSDMAALLKEREELIKALRIAYGWLPSVEGHLRDGRSFKADQAEVRTILESVLSRTPAAKGGE